MKAVLESRPMPQVRRQLYRPLWLTAAVAATLLALTMGLLLTMSWRNLSRLAPIQAHLDYLGRLEDTGLAMEQALLGALRDRTLVGPARLAELAERLAGDSDAALYLDPETRQRLEQVGGLLAQHQRAAPEALFSTLAELRRVLGAENRAHARLVEAVARDTRTELHLAMGLLAALPLTAVLVLFLLRGRIKRPLDHLAALLARLSERDYQPLPGPVMGEAAPMVQPLLRSYNALVARLQELEEEHRRREDTLEREVRAATGALLDQSRELARAERLAAVGAVSAGLAHELRNPLAGIQMACAKLRRGMQDPARTQRLDLVVAELKRINRLLTDMLSQAHSPPEPARVVDLAASVRDLLALARYQVPEAVHLAQTVPEGLTCRLPEGQLRQALLNLVLNAAQALDGHPGRIDVEAHRADGRLRLSVSDDGPGLPAALLEAGVRAFATHREQGTGLGLAMVRRFVRDLGGDMHLENPPSGGARVTLELDCEAYESQ
jgi:two-component system NtrC family sensor kinase